MRQPWAEHMAKWNLPPTVVGTITHEYLSVLDPDGKRDVSIAPLDEATEYEGYALGPIVYFWAPVQAGALSGMVHVLGGKHIRAGAVLKPDLEAAQYNSASNYYQDRDRFVRQRGNWADDQPGSPN